MSTTFPDPEWRNAAARLLAAINAARGSSLSHVKATLQEGDVVKIASSLAMDKYRPEDWFQPSQASGMAALHAQQPALNPQSDYRVLTLGALEEPVSRVSMRLGGIAFEDPFYAILACFNFGTYGRYFFLPRVSSVDRAWEQRNAIVSGLTDKSYRPERFFVQCTPMPKREGGLPVGELTVRGALLSQIRESGLGNISDGAGIAKYVLYAFAPEP